MWGGVVAALRCARGCRGRGHAAADFAPFPPPLRRYIAALLLSLGAMLHLELPHVNVLSKVDLLRHYGRLGAWAGVSINRGQDCSCI